MSVLILEPQRTVIVCPDCGQRYDPAKAAKIARVRTRDGRQIKPGRVEAQDVSATAHRLGRHHRAHVEVTCLSRNLWCVVTAELAAFAEAHEIPVESITVDSCTVLRFVRMEEFEDMAIAVESSGLRALCERIHRAACAVRLDHPWWRAYLHELGVSPDEIARGLTVTTDNRGDVLFERRPKLQPMPGPTLRGLL